MSTQKFGLISFADLDKKLGDSGKDPWLVDKLIPRCGVTLLVGPPRAGKTLLLCALSAAVKKGVPFLDCATRKTNILWISEDRGRAGIVANMKRACAWHGIKPTEINVFDPQGWKLDDPDEVEKLLTALNSFEIGLLVIDCLRRVTQADENSSTAMAEVCHQLNRLAEDKRAVVVIHHAGNNGKTRGSSDLPASAESEIKVTRDGKSKNVKLVAHHHTAAETSLVAVPRIQDKILSFELGSASRLKNVEQEVLRFLEARPEGVRKSELRKGIGGHTVRRTRHWISSSKKSGCFKRRKGVGFAIRWREKGEPKGARVWHGVGGTGSTAPPANPALMRGPKACPAMFDPDLESHG